MDDRRVIIHEQDGAWCIFDPNGVQLDGTSDYASKAAAEAFCDAHKLQYENTGLYLLPNPKTSDDQNTVYISVTERIDEFARKRYSDPGVHVYRTVLLRGQKLDENTHQVQVKLEGNGSFEREGGTHVFDKGDLLSGRPGSELGVWKTRQNG